MYFIHYNFNKKQETRTKSNDPVIFSCKTLQKPKNCTILTIFSYMASIFVIILGA